MLHSCLLCGGVLEVNNLEEVVCKNCGVQYPIDQRKKQIIGNTTTNADLKENEISKMINRIQKQARLKKEKWVSNECLSLQKQYPNDYRGWWEKEKIENDFYKMDDWRSGSVRIHPYTISKNSNVWLLANKEERKIIKKEIDHHNNVIETNIKNTKEFERQMLEAIENGNLSVLDGYYAHHIYSPRDESDIFYSNQFEASNGYLYLVTKTRQNAWPESGSIDTLDRREVFKIGTGIGFYRPGIFGQKSVILYAAIAKWNIFELRFKNNPLIFKTSKLPEFNKI